MCLMCELTTHPMMFFLFTRKLRHSVWGWQPKVRLRCIRNITVCFRWIYILCWALRYLLLIRYYHMFSSLPRFVMQLFCPDTSASIIWSSLTPIVEFKRASWELVGTIRRLCVLSAQQSRCLVFTSSHMLIDYGTRFKRWGLNPQSNYTHSHTHMMFWGKIFRKAADGSGL